MAIQSGFFRSDNEDRLYTAEFFTSYFASFIGNGVFPNPSTGMQVTVDSGTTVNVQPGKGWINGYYVVNTTPYQLTLGLADGVLSRIDRVVLQWNNDNREINIEVLQGTPSTNPVAPTLTRNNNLYELALADVRINAGTVNINQSSITDTRLNSQLCGIVAGTVNQVDTTTIFNQYQEAALQNIANDQARFDDFLASLEEALDGNVAGALNNRLNAVEVGLNTTNENVTSIRGERGQPNGFASLGSDGLLPSSQSRPSSITSVKFDTPGNYTWTVPSGVTRVLVSGCGAGGGGSARTTTSSLSGGFTAFGSYLTLTGGGGGGINQLPGVAGGFGATRGTSGLSGNAQGGSGIFGAGGIGISETGTASSIRYNSPPGFGGGGSGGYAEASARAYGGGAGACALDSPFTVTPGQTINITIGAGGATRTDLTTGSTDGGGGLLIIKYAQ